MSRPTPDAPAQLYRMRAGLPENLGEASLEEIGQGTLAKMVRIALSDPDDALWAYSISTNGRTIAGREILHFRELANLPIAGRPSAS